eukprot:scaffold201137_cov31-Tisochrysis_lutea.AAC.1
MSDAELRALAEEESKLEAWAAELEAQAQQLEAQRAATKAALASAHRRAEREAELQQWSARLQAGVSRAVGLLELQRRKEIEKCRAFESSLEKNIATLEAMRLGVRKRADALDASYAQTAHRMLVVAEEALLARRAQLNAEHPAAPQPARSNDESKGT